MAKTRFIDVPDELKGLQAKSVQQRDRFLYGVVQGQKSLLPRSQRRALSRKAIINSPMEGRGSLFRYLSPLWRGLNSTQKNTWKDAAAYSNLTNWQLFISDNAARIRNSLTLEVPPSDLWQVRAGQILIADPASSICLKQEHPLDYWVTQKVPGKPWKYQLLRLTESFALPLTITIRYTSNLELVGDGAGYTPPAGDAVDFELQEYTPPEGNAADFSFAGGAYARFAADVWTSYQGEDVFQRYSLNFSPTADWTELTRTIDGLRGILIGYTLYLEISGYRGELLFDNIESVHGGTNWARDPRCDDISKEFKKAFAIVPPFWVPVDLPEGASFSSQYPPALS